MQSESSDGRLTQSVSQQKKNETGLLSMVDYCEDVVECRRVSILKHFGEVFTGTCAVECDNCRRRGIEVPVVRDCSNVAKMICEFVTSASSRIKGGISLAVVRDALLGIKSCKKLAMLEHRCGAIGALKREGWKAGEVQRVLRQLVIKQILSEYIVQLSTSGPANTAAYVRVEDNWFNMLQLMTRVVVATTSSSSVRQKRTSPHSTSPHSTSDICAQQPTLTQLSSGPKRVRKQPLLHSSIAAPLNWSIINVNHDDDKPVGRISVREGFEDWAGGRVVTPADASRLKAALLEIRGKLAAARKIKVATSIINEFGVNSVVTALPETVEDLEALQIPGFCSKTKMEKYALPFVTCVKSFLASLHNPVVSHWVR
eukprot:GHVN01096523.1.p1 GENE.GHVN01096523.1~~GHVN01096523.1.p1  ORF type:complete len:371 (-),score=72.71 GHVN01096523.1:383-1495(-)